MKMPSLTRKTKREREREREGRKERESLLRLDKKAEKEIRPAQRNVFLAAPSWRSLKMRERTKQWQ